MNSFLTICFYENPAAMVHINLWENIMKDRILKKTIDKDNIIFLVKRNDDIECLICTPTTTKSFEFFKTTILSVKEYSKSVPETFKYLKTLVFGKATSEQLQSILKITTSFENTKCIMPELFKIACERFVKDEHT